MYKTNIRSWLKHLDFILLDIFAITFAFGTAYLIRESMGRGLRDDISYRSFYLTIIGFHIIIAILGHGYSNIIRRNRTDELKSVLKHIIMLLGCVMFYLVFTKQSEPFSRFFLGILFGLSSILMLIFRLFLKKWLRRTLKNSRNMSRLLIITKTTQQARRCLDQLDLMQYQPFRIIGIVLLNGKDSDDKICDIPVVADADNMLEYIRLNAVDEILLYADVITDKTQILAEQFLQMGIAVHISLDQLIDTLPHRQMQQLGELSVITTSFQTIGTEDLILKRAMDICGAIVGLLLTGIAFLFVAPVIYSKSPGPIFFSQYRMGQNGRKFKIYKFRSMYVGADEQKKKLMDQNKIQGHMFKLDNDPRIIKGIGHFIRNTSIDELPQFWNILKGDMSLVGTRPPTVDEFEHYQLHHKIRLSFRPGLTGLWQVSGRSDITDFEEVVKLDEQYIANWSIWLDIKILLKTINVVLRQKGSE